MSATQIYDRFAPLIVEACAAGRGEVLLDEYIKSIAADFANTVFLKMDSEAAKATSETIDDVAKWLKRFNYLMGLDLINTTAEALEAFRLGSDKIDAKLVITSRVYQERLNVLFETSQAGGSA